MKKEKFNITGMTCAACQANITKKVGKLEGVAGVDVSLLANQMSVEYDEKSVDANKIAEAIQSIGYGAAPLDQPASGKKGGIREEWLARKKSAEDHQKSVRARLWWSVALLVPLMYLAMGEMLGLPIPGIFAGAENALVSALTQFLISLIIILLNRNFFVTGFKALAKRAPNMDSLVAIGAAAALLYGAFAIYAMAYALGHGNASHAAHYAHLLYFESAAMILTLVTVGKYLEARSKAKTSDALGKLIDLSPKTATVVRDGSEVSIPAEEVRTGDIVVIRPGESIPVDGEVVEGAGYVDQSAITGESVPVEARPGSQVISATINKNSLFRMRASRVGDDTTLSQIIRLVDEAGNSKAPIARLADRVSGVFVPVVIGIALVAAIIWLIAGQKFEFALSTAIAILVISCPCALGLATPVAIMVGTGKAAEYGILIKSAEALETLHSVDTVVLDKTGTITSGHPSVTDVQAEDPRALLRIAAALEAGSEHPLAEAVVERAKADGIDFPRAEAFEAVAGLGVRATVEGKNIIAGSASFMAESGVKIDPDAQSACDRFAREGKTPILFAAEDAILGVVAVADTIRTTSREAIRRLRDSGVKVVMLTGDNRVTAEAVREAVGIDEAVAEVLPTDKEAHVRALMEQGRKVAMVGDGINDAPALTRADIGIAIGAGTDIAIESADVVLMKDSLMDVATAMELSRKVVRNIHMNLFWAFFYNVLGIPIAAGALYPAFGVQLSPMIASAAMSLSSVSVVLNALRLRFFRSKNAPEDEHIPKTGKEDLSMKKVIDVEGMMCAHCQMHVKKALEEIDGVTKADVSLESKSATVTMTKDVPDQALKDAVTEAGYTPAGVRAQ
jgi:heavy metal translocating P-type ATPase